MSIRVLSRDFAFYGVLDVIQRSLGILLVPIYTRVLTQSSYGNLDLILTSCSALTVLIDLQFLAGFSRLYLENRRSGNGPRFVGTTFITRVGLGALLVLLFLTLGHLGLLEWSFIPSFNANRTAWTIALLSIPVTFGFDILLMQAQMLRFKKWFVIGAVGNTLISTSLCVGLTLFLRMGVVGVVAGQLIGLSVATLLLFIGLRREIAFDYHRRLLREVATYALPLVPGRWMGHATAYASRFFIYAALGASENAILAITSKLTAAVGLFCVAFRTAWQPLAMAYIGQEEGERFFVRSLRIFMAGGIFSVCAFTLLLKPILAILAPASYHVAEYYAPSFFIATIVGELDVSLQLGNQIAKRTYWISLASGCAFAINLLILATLTTRFGIHAAGIGLLLSLAVKATITYFSSQRSHPIGYDKRSILLFAASCVALLMLAVGRSMEIVGSGAFYGGTAMIGMFVPFLMVDHTERNLIRVALWNLVGKFTSGWRLRHRETPID